MHPENRRGLECSTQHTLCVQLKGCGLWDSSIQMEISTGTPRTKQKTKRKSKYIHSMAVIRRQLQFLGPVTALQFRVSLAAFRIRGDRISRHCAGIYPHIECGADGGRFAGAPPY